MTALESAILATVGALFLVGAVAVCIVAVAKYIARATYPERRDDGP